MISLFLRSKKIDFRLAAEQILNMSQIHTFSLADKKFREPPFEQLESLVCVSESAPNIIEFLLVHAKNLNHGWKNQKQRRQLEW